MNNKPDLSITFDTEKLEFLYFQDLKLYKTMDLGEVITLLRHIENEDVTNK